MIPPNFVITDQMSKLDVLVLGAGEFVRTDSNYPAFLNELDTGELVIEKIIASLRLLNAAHYLFAFRQEDVRCYRLDNVIGRLMPGARIISIAGSTRGAACTALLAIDDVEQDHELLLVSANELLEVSLPTIVRRFRSLGWAAATLTFRSVHPRYSYVAVDAEGLVVEAAQHNPISLHATTGMFWFARAGDFFEAAQAMIRKDISHNGEFFIAPVLNEMILKHRTVGHLPIEPKQYRPLKSVRQIAEFENVHHLAAAESRHA